MPELELFVSFWKAFVDVRLISVPTEPQSIRVAIRVINDSPAPAKAQSDFLDANVYAVRLSVAVPKEVHRPTIFQELPASFRYDRQMPGVGINSHVCEEQNGALLQLTAESVPQTETARLEARRIPRCCSDFCCIGLKSDSCARGSCPAHGDVRRDPMGDETDNAFGD